jgi:CRP/FNR family transcriptional regulator
MNSSLDETIRLLENLTLLQGVPQDDLRRLAQTTNRRGYQADEVVFYQGDEADRVWLVASGRVKIVYHELDGREIILEIISPGEAFGGGVLFFPAHPATGKALEDCELVSFSTQMYENFIADQPQIALRVLRMLGIRHLAMINMQILAGERVERRMAHILLKLALRIGRQDEEGTLITIPLSRQDLADMACTTLETAIRTISRFTKSGILSTRRGGYLVVNNLDELQKLTQ